jgi:putative hydroxymethylpyrimidine transport system substrate-binding protein
MVALDGWRDPEMVGILMARERGYNEDAGLDVQTLSPASPTVNMQDVLSGFDDFGVSHEPEVVLAKEKGAPIVIVGSLVSHPTAAMVWLKKSKIGSIADLKGKTIAFPGLPSQKDLLQTILAQEGLTLDDVKLENAGTKLLSSLLSGHADAIFGGSWNVEGAELEARGLEPVIKRVEDAGVPPYDELVLIARSDLVAEDPQLVRAFVSAVLEGNAATVEDPEGTARVLDGAVESNPEAGLKETEAGVEATAPLLSEDGHVDPAQARALVDWMYEEGMIQKKVPTATLLTNAYLPK